MKRIILRILVFFISSTIKFPLLSQTTKESNSYVYEIHGIDEYLGGDYYYIYSINNRDAEDSATVEIHINNNDSIKVQNETIYFISLDKDTISLSTDHDGTINIPYTLLKKYPLMYIPPIVFKTKGFNHRPIKYIEENILINTSKMVSEFKECLLKEMYVTLRNSKFDIMIFVIESPRTLSNEEIDCIKKDIIIGRRICSAWHEIKLFPLIEI